jgi:hypothetical protein
MLDLIDLSIESKTVNTETTQNIPMVMPSRDKIVRVLFALISAAAIR